MGRRTPFTVASITILQRVPRRDCSHASWSGFALRYSVAAETRVTNTVYDVFGRAVAVLVNAIKRPGEYSVAWNAEGIPTGMYFYRLTAGGYNETKATVLLK